MSLLASKALIWIFCSFLIPKNLWVDTRINFRRAKKSYEQTFIFHVIVAAIFDFYAFHCFGFFYLFCLFILFVIPIRNKCVETEMNMLGTFKKKL